MAERAAHLVEEILPTVRVRQWVLTVPHRLRYRLAFDHALCRAVLGVFVRAVLGDYRRRARRRGLRDGQGGSVTVIQRFGSGRLSSTTFRANAVRLQLHALAYNLANFLRTLALPGEIAQWSLTTLREKVVKIGAKVVAHGRYLVFQMAEVAVPQELFRRLLDRIVGLHPPAVARC
jgi:hypothetical protein